MRALVERLSDEQLRQPLDGGWTVSAVLAHLAFWDRRALVLLDRWERDGVGPSPVDAEVVNDALLPQWRALPVREAASAALTAADEVDRRLETISDALLAAIQGPDRSLNLSRAEHRRDHLAELERALGR